MRESLSTRSPVTPAAAVPSRQSPPTRMVQQRLVSEATTRLEKGIDNATVPLLPIQMSVIFTLLVDGVPVTNNRLTLSFVMLPLVELKSVKTFLKGQVKSFLANSVDLRLKLYYLMPMVIGLKRVKMGENMVHLADNVEFKVNRLTL